MGPFSWPLRISDLHGRPSREIEATVGTSTAYTMLPAGSLGELAVEPMGQRRFLLAAAGASTWTTVRRVSSNPTRGARLAGHSDAVGSCSTETRRGWEPL